MDFTGLSSFYYSVQQARQILKSSHTPREIPGVWFFEEPLFFNTISKILLQSVSLHAKLRDVGCTKLGHLRKLIASPMDIMRGRGKISSIRLINRVAEENLRCSTTAFRRFCERPVSSWPVEWGLWLWFPLFVNQIVFCKLHQILVLHVPSYLCDDFHVSLLHHSLIIWYWNHTQCMMYMGRLKNS